MAGSASAGGASGGRNEVEPWLSDNEHYEEIASIGEGAYGKVFHVRHTLTGQHFAKKKIHVILSDEGIPQCVIREISALKSLERSNHPNIIKLIDVCHGLVSERELYIHVVFEKCDFDLYEYLNSLTAPLPENVIRSIALQLLRGIDFLHSHNVVHRDLKPQNVLINRDGAVKIGDFGLARTYTRHCRHTTVVVTLWYRSPEVLLQCSYASAVDLWSFGCMLAEFYRGGRALWPGATESEQIHLILQSIGTPSLAEWPRDAAVTRDTFPSYPPQLIQRILPTAPPDCHALLAHLLVFNEETRLSAQQALSTPYFTHFQAEPIMIPQR